MQNSARKLCPILCIFLCSLIFAALPWPLPVNAQNATTQDTQETPPSISNNDSKISGGDKKNILSEAVDAITEQDPLALALKNIELTMGENGFEVWRLKAQWASMKESDGSIEVLKPQIVYSMSEDAHATPDSTPGVAMQPAASDSEPPTSSTQDPASSPSKIPHANATTGASSSKLPLVPGQDDENIILVTADKGVVRQKEKLITLEGDVNAVRGTSRLTGPRMIYDGQARSITFTDGMHFSGNGVTGQASRGGWDLKDNIITADGGVNLVYDAPMPASLKNIDQPAEETADLKSDDDKTGLKAASAEKEQVGQEAVKAKRKLQPVKKSVTAKKKKPQASKSAK